MPANTLDLALASESIDDAERIFTEAYEQYGEEEIRWIGRRFGEWWRTHQNRIHMGRNNSTQWSKMTAMSILTTSQKRLGCCRFKQN